MNKEKLFLFRVIRTYREASYKQIVRRNLVLLMLHIRNIYLSLVQLCPIIVLGLFTRSC